jgi:hypothetical protein
MAMLRASFYSAALDIEGEIEPNKLDPPATPDVK